MHKSVDDTPFGGGPGMVMMIEPLRAALQAARAADPAPARAIYLSPQGAPLTQKKARELAALPQQIRGYGFIKEAAMEKAAVRRAELLAEFRAGGRPTSAPMAMAAE